MLAKSGASLAGTGEAPVERRFEALHTGAMPLIGHTRSSSCCYGVGGHTDCDERPGYGWIPAHLGRDQHSEGDIQCLTFA
jgi:hypothetical protein